jgi:hypothetical protein
MALEAARREIAESSRCAIATTLSGNTRKYPTMLDK